jgi:TatA/E family protein of Tat protein translocase
MEHGIIGILVIAMAAVLIFGGSKKIEDLGRGFGGFMREFNKARREVEQEPVALPAKKKAVKRPSAKKTKKKA